MPQSSKAACCILPQVQVQDTGLPHKDLKNTTYHYRYCSTCGTFLGFISPGEELETQIVAKSYLLSMQSPQASNGQQTSLNTSLGATGVSDLHDRLFSLNLSGENEPEPTMAGIFRNPWKQEPQHSLAAKETNRMDTDRTDLETSACSPASSHTPYQAYSSRRPFSPEMSPKQTYCSLNLRDQAASLPSS